MMFSRRSLLGLVATLPFMGWLKSPTFIESLAKTYQVKSWNKQSQSVTVSPEFNGVVIFKEDGLLNGRPVKAGTTHQRGWQCVSGTDTVSCVSKPTRLITLHLEPVEDKPIKGVELVNEDGTSQEIDLSQHAIRIKWNKDSIR